MTKEKKAKNRFYWHEGVSRSEVVRSLSDQRPSRLRQQGPRRLLVVGTALVIATLALTIFITQTKFRSYSEIGLMVLGLVLYFQLRKAVRLISDAPNELLDERQIALRDAAYTVAYRNLITLTVAYGALLYAVTPGGALHELVGEKFWSGIVWSYLLTGACLPAMVLAWRMPSEPEDEPPEHQPDRLSDGPP